ncbi:MAG: hypothetical protein ThorAB25_03550 [Candidatus Thorarchaeota archaeon AB_25]|nr:MAG: hypothetical protein ThorAB25_03550 [Candidatus Thorarchaeota archaeon AB_25]
MRRVITSTQHTNLDFKSLEQRRVRSRNLVSQSGWKYAAIIIFTGFVILMVAEVLYFTGMSTVLSAMTTALSPFIALFLGILGLNFFGRESLVKEDRFHAMNVWMALGLVVFSLAEITGFLIRITESSTEIFFTIGLVQMPALLLWGVGVIGYLRSSNSALGVFTGNRIGSILFIVTAISSLALVVILILINPSQNLLATFVSVPMIVGLGVILCVLGGIIWILREGLIARPLILMFLGVLMLLIRSLFWGIVTYSPGSPFDYVTAIEGYILVGASLAAASRLDDVYMTRDEEEVE